MKYIYTNIFFFSCLAALICLAETSSCDVEVETEIVNEVDPDYEVNWDVTIAEIERDAEIYGSWNF